MCLVPSLAANVHFFAASNATTQVCYANFTPVSGPTALQVTVTVTYNHPIFIPLLSGVLGNSIATTTSLSIPVGMEQPYSLPSPPDPTQACSS